MKIGYPCQNWTLKQSTNNTFRLASLSEEKFSTTVEKNLEAFDNILQYNKEQGYEFFRIGSRLIPFASHPDCPVHWQELYKQEFEQLGETVKKNQFRVSMHPDQFVLINSPKEAIVKNSIAELEYHADVLDLMKLDNTAKIQIHVGGVYGDKPLAIERFIQNYSKLPEKVRNRLVIENDDVSFSLKDCLEIHDKTTIPILFDNFHHECLNNEEDMRDAVLFAQKTWKQKDGMLMTDYSSQEPGERKGKHVTSINEQLFSAYLEKTKGIDFDIMLEIKDKEASARTALSLIQH